MHTAVTRYNMARAAATLASHEAGFRDVTDAIDGCRQRHEELKLLVGSEDAGLMAFVDALTDMAKASCGDDDAGERVFEAELTARYLDNLMSINEQDSGSRHG